MIPLPVGIIKDFYFIYFRFSGSFFYRYCNPLKTIWSHNLISSTPIPFCKLNIFKKTKVSTWCIMSKTPFHGYNLIATIAILLNLFIPKISSTKKTIKKALMPNEWLSFVSLRKDLRDSRVRTVRTVKCIRKTISDYIK